MKTNTNEFAQHIGFPRRGIEISRNSLYNISVKKIKTVLNSDFNAKSFINFYNNILQLKKITRKGWAERNVPNPESAADHTFGVAILALFFSRRKNLNVERAITTALIHDVCESLTGDITPNDNIPPREKQEKECKAAQKIFGQIDESGELFELWKDFEYERTPEGKLIKELDRLEMVMQASYYEKEHNIKLDEFYDFVDKKLTSPDLKKIFREILELK
jgi:putative hydrolase of HD superfamily